MRTPTRGGARRTLAWRVLSSLVVVSATSYLMGCAKNAASSGPSNLTFSGTLTAGSSGLVQALVLNPLAQAERRLTLHDFNNLSIVCATLSVPPVAVTGTVDSTTGAFTISGLTPDVAMKCAVVDTSATPASIIATFIYQDSNKKDMAGNSSTSETVAPHDSVNLGSVDYSLASGEAIADGSLVTQLSSGVTAFDFTAEYAIESIGSALPDGYSDTCEDQHSEDCHGPSNGEHVYLHRLVGKEFTPDAACDAAKAAAEAGHTPLASCSGTVGTADSYGVGVWSSAATFTTCGSKLGFNLAEGKGYGHVDFSTADATEGDMSWSSSMTISSQLHTLTDGWKSDRARSNWEINNCVPGTKAGHDVYTCTDSGNNLEQVNLQDGNGCYDASNNAIQNIDWSQVTWGSCTQQALTGALSGMTENTCTSTYQGQTITCKNTMGIFNATTHAPTSGMFDWSHARIAAQNTLCSDIYNGTGGVSGAHELQGLQCYANFFWQNIEREARSGAVCVPQIRTDWSATSAAAFIDTNGPRRAIGEHMIGKMDFLPGNSFTMRDAENDFRGIRVQDASGNSTYVNCRVRSANSITATLMPNGVDLQVVFVQVSKNVSTDIPACEGSSEINGVSRSMFIMRKQ
jgi:hypothetical protein